jgi:urease accessory protein
VSSLFRGRTPGLARATRHAHETSVDFETRLVVFETRRMPVVELRQSQKVTPGWRARLELRLGRIAGRTALERRWHQGPLMVQRPFHPEADGTAHVYVLHPPGGVAGGDRLDIDVEVRSGASALITTPAATKLYRTAGERAHVSQSLGVRSGAVLEWLPQETIAFRGADAELSTRVTLEPGAHYAGWEIVCLGRPASGDTFEHGSLSQRTELAIAGRPVVIERLSLSGASALRSGAWGLGGRSVYGCLLSTGASEALVADVRERVRPEAPGDLFAVTTLDGVLVCRYLGSSAARARACLTLAWERFRHHVLGKSATAPRIWRT